MKKCLIIVLLFNIAGYSYGMQAIKHKDNLSRLALFGARSFSNGAYMGDNLPFLLKNLGDLKSATDIKSKILEEKHIAAGLALVTPLGKIRGLAQKFKAEQQDFFAKEGSLLADGKHDQEIPEKLLEYIKYQLHSIDINPYKVDIVADDIITGALIRDDVEYIVVLGKISVARNILREVGFDQQMYLVDHEMVHIKENDTAMTRLLQDKQNYVCDLYNLQAHIGYANLEPLVNYYEKLVLLIRNYSYLTEYAADALPVIEDSKKISSALDTIDWLINESRGRIAPGITHPSWDDRKKFIKFIKSCQEQS